LGGEGPPQKKTPGRLKSKPPPRKKGFRGFPPLIGEILTHKPPFLGKKKREGFFSPLRPKKFGVSGKKKAPLLGGPDPPPLPPENGWDP